MMILRRLGGGDEVYYTHVNFRLYVEEPDDPGLRRGIPNRGINIVYKFILSPS